MGHTWLYLPAVGYILLDSRQTTLTHVGHPNQCLAILSKREHITLTSCAAKSPPRPWCAALLLWAWAYGPAKQGVWLVGTTYFDPASRHAEQQVQSLFSALLRTQAFQAVIPQLRKHLQLLFWKCSHRDKQLKKARVSNYELLTDTYRFLSLKVICFRAYPYKQCQTLREHMSTLYIEHSVGSYLHEYLPHWRHESMRRHLVAAQRMCFM